MRLVKVIAKMKAHSPLLEEDVLSCQIALSPPACLPIHPASVAEPTGVQAETTDQHPQSDAGESNKRLRRKGGDQ